MNFQTRLTNIRRSKGFTQKQVADGIGISEVGLQNYENGRRKPAFDVLISLARWSFRRSGTVLNPARLRGLFYSS